MGWNILCETFWGHPGLYAFNVMSASWSSGAGGDDGID